MYGTCGLWTHVCTCIIKHVHVLDFDCRNIWWLCVVARCFALLLLGFLSEFNVGLKVGAFQTIWGSGEVWSTAYGPGDPASRFSPPLAVYELAHKSNQLLIPPLNPKP